jgi:GGDEF domain-containing protein
VARLRRRIALLLIWLTIFFAVEGHIDVGAGLGAFASGATLVGLAAALAPLMPLAGRRRLLVSSTLVFTLFLAALALDPAPDFGGANTYVTGIALAFVTLTFLLSTWVGRALDEFQHAVEALTLPDLGSRVRTLREAEETLELELAGSRRSQRSLSLIVLQIDMANLHLMAHRLIQDMQRAMMRRYAFATVAHVLTQRLRRTDLIVEDRRTGRLMIVAPDTAADAATTLCERLTEQIRKQTGLTTSFGVADFPQQALTFEEMVNIADQQLHEQQHIYIPMMKFRLPQRLKNAQRIGRQKTSL